MKPADRETLLEAANGAWRDRSTEGRIQPATAWWDLSPEDREALFERQVASRALERALDADGLSSTVRAVLERIR